MTGTRAANADSEARPAAGPRAVEVCVSLLFWALVVAGLFHEVTLGGRTLSSAPHQAFTLPHGPVGGAWDGPRFLGGP